MILRNSNICWNEADEKDVKSHHSLYWIRNHLAMWNSFNRLTHTHTLARLSHPFDFHGLCFFSSCLFPCLYLSRSRLVFRQRHSNSSSVFKHTKVYRVECLANECSMVWMKYNNEFLIDTKRERMGCLVWNDFDVLGKNFHIQFTFRHIN